jgi:hypothetical protein
MLTENHEMLDLLKRLGPVQSISRACGTVEIEVPIPPAGALPALGELLRVTALHDVVVPRAIEPPRRHWLRPASVRRNLRRSASRGRTPTDSERQSRKRCDDRSPSRAPACTV